MSLPKFTSVEIFDSKKPLTFLTNTSILLSGTILNVSFTPGDSVYYIISIKNSATSSSLIDIDAANIEIISATSTNAPQIKINNFDLPTILNNDNTINQISFVLKKIDGTFTTENISALQIYVLPDLTITSTSLPLNMTPVSNYTTDNNNLCQIHGTGFSNNSIVRIWKNNDALDCIEYACSNISQKYNSVIQCVCVDPNTISMEFDMEYIFPDLHSRHFQIQIYDSVTGLESRRRLLLVNAYILYDEIEENFYNLPTNTLTVGGYGFFYYNFNDKTLSVTPPTIFAFDDMYINSNYSSNFTISADITHPATNEMLTLIFTPLLVKHDEFHEELIDLFFTKVNIVLYIPALNIILNDPLVNNIYSVSNKITIQLYKAIFTDDGVTNKYDHNAYKYAVTSFALITEFNNKYLSDLFDIPDELFSPAHLIPIFDKFEKSSTAFTHTFTNITGGSPETFTHNDVFKNILLTNKITNPDGSTQYNQDLLFLAIDAHAKILATAFTTYLTGAGFRIGVISSYDIARLCIQYIVDASKYAPMNIKVGTLLTAETTPVKYYAYETTNLYDYVLEPTTIDIGITATTLQNSFSYLNSNNGVILSINANNKIPFKEIIDLLFLNTEFALLSDDGKYKNSLFVAPNGTLPWQYISQIRSYLLQNPRAGGPIRNEAEIMLSIKTGLQKDGTQVSYGTQITDDLFTLTTSGDVGEQVKLLYDQLTAQDPGRFVVTDDTTPVPFPFLPGDTICLYSLIGGPITTTNESLVNNPKLSIYNIFKNLCAPKNAITTSKEYLLDSNGENLRYTKNLIRIRII